MFDELESLARSPALLHLLTHYVERSGSDRQAWHDRLMRLDGCAGRDLVRLHGKLIAYGWLEQNTGVLSAPRPDAVPACYRATRGGIKVVEQARSS